MKSLLVFALSVVMPPLAPVQAQARELSVPVHAAGLDLSRPAGIRKLDLRLLHAASALCGIPSPADRFGRIRFDRCRAEALASAAAQRERAIAIARAATLTNVAARR